MTAQGLRLGAPSNITRLPGRGSQAKAHRPTRLGRRVTLWWHVMVAYHIARQRTSYEYGSRYTTSCQVPRDHHIALENKHK